MDHVFSDAFISVSGYELKATVIGIEDGNEELEGRRMGDTAGRKVPGIAVQRITASFIQDYGSASVHEALTAARTATKAGQPVTVIVQPKDAEASPSNPMWTGSMMLFRYDPIPSVAAHNLGTVTVVFETNGTALQYSEAGPETGA